MALTHVKDAILIARDVLDHGDEKYGVAAWDRTDRSLSENMLDHARGAKRHLDRLLKEREHVDESGYHALAHVSARALIALTFANRMCLKRGGPYTCLLPRGHEGKGAPRHEDEFGVWV